MNKEVNHVMSLFYIIFSILLILFASVLYLQYPLSSTFPIGGDATRYILDYLEVRDSFIDGNILQAIHLLFTNTQYPFSQLLVLLSSFIPLSWPSRFISLITLGNVLTGAMLSFFLYRYKGWRAALFGFFIWSLTVTQVTDHLQDGTLAQLWSLIPLLLFFYFLIRKAWIGILFSFIASFLFHPLSGIVAALSYALIVPGSWSINRLLSREDSSYIKKHLYVFPIALSLSSLLLFGYAPWLFITDFDERGFPLLNIMASPFGFSMLLAPLGTLMANTEKERKLLPFVILLSFSFVSVFLSMNDVLGIGILPYRFKTYLILAAAFFGAIGLSELTKQLLPRATQLTAILLLCASLTAASWHENKPVYVFYESPSKYARLHPDELEAITWLKGNASHNDIVISTRANRHSEWIPILSHVTWTAYTSNGDPWDLPESSFLNFLKDQGVTYIVIFKHRESVDDVLGEKVDLFNMVFENKGSVIYELK